MSQEGKVQPLSSPLLIFLSFMPCMYAIEVLDPIFLGVLSKAFLKHSVSELLDL